MLDSGGGGEVQVKDGRWKLVRVCLAVWCILQDASFETSVHMRHWSSLSCCLDHCQFGEHQGWSMARAVFSSLHIVFLPCFVDSPFPLPLPFSHCFVNVSSFGRISGSVSKCVPVLFCAGTLSSLLDLSTLHLPPSLLIHFLVVLMALVAACCIFSACQRSFQSRV